MKIKLFRTISFSPWHSSVAMPKAAEIKDAVSKTIEIACGKRFQGTGFGATCAFINSEKIREYNREFRGKDETTDVLSFPEYNFETKKWEDIFMAEKSKYFYLGDILLSYENILEDAKYMNWKPYNRVIHLIVHSVLHLLGFDHIEEDDRIAMESLEVKILDILSLPNPFQ